MIDSHCHLTDPRLLEQLPAVLERAAAAGIDRIITVGTDIEDDIASINVCHGRANIRCAIGIHPNFCKDAKVEDVQRLRDLQKDPSVLALGEMGLDYHYDYAPRDWQRPIFEAQLQLARELDRPVVIHCREAVDDTLAILASFPGVQAVFHCFTGTPEEARRILAAGYWLSFTGVITFPKNDEIRQVVRLTPLDRMMLETDAPYLSPAPMRKQKTNEPALIVHTAAMAGELKGLDREHIQDITTANALRFFRWNG